MQPLANSSKLEPHLEMPPLFGDFRVRVDLWEVDYGDQTPLSPLDDRPDEQVDHEVELADHEWEAVRPPESTPVPGRVVFVDGVRRLEARIHARQGEHLIYGAFGSHGVGAVEADSAGARFRELRVFRTAVLGSGQRLPKSVQVRRDLVYSAESTAATEVDGPLRHIQKAMRLAEATLARDISRDDSLTIVDGPLSFEPERRGLALGYIKRIHELYLPSKFIPLLATLPAGTRTPLFTIQSAKAGFARYAWFQRLADPGPGATDLHGIVRLEVAAEVGVDIARGLADTAAAWLPRTAPRRARDPRSPQNLLPIGALEQRLRVQLGDARLIRRWIETLVAREASHG